MSKQNKSLTSLRREAEHANNRLAKAEQKALAELRVQQPPTGVPSPTAAPAIVETPPPPPPTPEQIRMGHFTRGGSERHLRTNLVNPNYKAPNTLFRCLRGR